MEYVWANVSDDERRKDDDGKKMNDERVEKGAHGLPSSL